MPDDDLLGLSELADLLGVTRQTITNWRSRRKDFPPPVAELKSGPIWTRLGIAKWAADNAFAIREGPQADSGPAKATRSTVVSVMNMKGGVGKSTITANLGWFCAYQNINRVLLVDLDPQFNLSQYAMGSEAYKAHIDSGKGTIVDLFEQFTPAPVSGKRVSALKPDDIIAPVRAWDDGSSLDLIPSRLELAWTVKHSGDKAHLLANFLDEVRSNYDVILIDCAPTESTLTTAAYMASDSILVPVRPEFLSTIGLPLVVRSIEDFKASYKDRTLDVLGVVFNASGDKLEHDQSRKYVRKVAKNEGWYVFKNEISFSDSYPKGSRLGSPIFLTSYARSSKIADFFKVAEEFLARVDS